MLREPPELAIALIKKHEGLRDGDPGTPNYDPYMDPVGIWTIGWGHAICVDGRFLVGKKDRLLANSLYPSGITLEEAETLLRADLLAASRDVASITHVPLTDGQFGALLSWVFNLGVSKVRHSTLIRLLNVKAYLQASEEFGRWVYGKDEHTGRSIKLPGLVARREDECALFLS